MERMNRAIVASLTRLALPPSMSPCCKLTQRRPVSTLHALQRSCWDGRACPSLPARDLAPYSRCSPARTPVFPHRAVHYPNARRGRKSGVKTCVRYTLALDRPGGRRSPCGNAHNPALSQRMSLRMQLVELRRVFCHSQRTILQSCSRLDACVAGIELPRLAQRR